MVLHSDYDGMIRAITAQVFLLQNLRGRRMDRLSNWAKVEGGVATVTASVPPANWDHRLCVRKLIWLCSAYGGPCLATQWCRPWPKYVPCLLSMKNAQQPMAMKCNTFTICGTKGFSWVSVVCLESGPVSWAASGARGNAKREGNWDIPSLSTGMIEELKCPNEREKRGD